MQLRGGATVTVAHCPPVLRLPLHRTAAFPFERRIRVFSVQYASVVIATGHRRVARTRLGESILAPQANQPGDLPIPPRELLQCWTGGVEWNSDLA